MGIFTGYLLFDLLGIVTSLIVVFLVTQLWKFQYWKRRNVQYLEPSMPFGNFSNPFLMKESVSETFNKLYFKVKSKGWKYSGIYGIFGASFFIMDLDLLKSVMTKDFEYFMNRGIYVNERDDPLSGHLFALEGSKWRNMRMKLTPTFTSGKLKAMFQTLVDCGLIFEKYLEEHIKEGEGVDIKNIAGNFTTDIIGSCAFGLECNSFNDPNSPFREKGKKIFIPTAYQIIKHLITEISPSLAKVLRISSNHKDVNDFFLKIVKDTIEYRKNNNYRRNDFLQLLIDMKNKEGKDYHKDEKGKSLTVNEIAAQSFLFFIAGFETSSTTMTFVLYLLAKHPEIQDKVREEIRTVLKGHNDQITYESLSEMTYLTQVINEALRLYPPVPLLIRVCNKDYKIPGEDIIIDKNIKVIIPLYSIQHDEEYYENPEVFNPDRFSEENTKNRHPYAFMPFGEGPRICIGERFGMMQTKVGLACLLRKFKVSLNEKTSNPLKLDPKMFITSAKGGIWLNIEKI